jgi:hypothetical protein
MRKLRIWVAKARGMFGLAQADRDMEVEMEEHLRLLALRFASRGMSAGDAMVAARRQFGNASLARQREREGRMVLWMVNLNRDVRYALQRHLQRD